MRRCRRRMDRRTAATGIIVAVVAVLLVSVFGRDADAARTGAEDRAVVRGRATLDGASFDAPYLGAAVKRNGLVTPCQLTLPPVRDGRFAIRVRARTEARGCGAAGSQIFLWTFVQEQIVYSSQSVRWPGNGKAARFDPAVLDRRAHRRCRNHRRVRRRDLRPCQPAAAAGCQRRGTHRRDAVRSCHDPAYRQLHRIQHRRGWSGLDSGVRDRWHHHVPGRRARGA